jgi:hypothetical protein
MDDFDLDFEEKLDTSVDAPQAWGFDGKQAPASTPAIQPARSRSRSRDRPPAADDDSSSAEEDGVAVVGLGQEGDGTGSMADYLGRDSVKPKGQGKGKDSPQKGPQQRAPWDVAAADEASVARASLFTKMTSEAEQLADRIEFQMDNDEKPWMQPNQDLTAYFNFGLNERGFKELIRMQVMKRFEMKQKTKIKSVTTKSGSGEATVQQFTGVASAKSSIAAELFGGNIRKAEPVAVEVWNIPVHWQEAIVKPLFEPFGQTRSLRCRGAGDWIVEFRSADHARQACRTLDGASPPGVSMPLKCRLASGSGGGGQAARDTGAMAGAMAGALDFQ